METSEPKQRTNGHSIWENIFVVFALLLSTGAIIPLLHKQSGMVFNHIQGNTVLQLIWLAIYVITCYYLLLRLNIDELPLQTKLIIVLVGLAFISVSWSDTPLLTLRRSMALIGTTLFGIYLAISYNRQGLLKMLMWTVGSAAVLSLAFVLLMPSYGLHSNDTWRGIYDNKNTFGSIITLSVIVSAVYLIASKKSYYLGFGFCALSITMLFLSNSVTSLLIFFLLALMLLLGYVIRVAYFRNARFVIFVIISVFGLVICWLINNQDALWSILNRDATFTGRTAIWQVVWKMIQYRPWWGYGYSAFWLGWEGPSNYVWHMIKWSSPNAHNGYLDVWLQLGFAGLFIFMMSLFIVTFKAIVLALREKSLSGVFYLLILTLMLIQNISESTFMFQNNIIWILYVAISVRLGIELKDRSSAT